MQPYPIDLEPSQFVLWLLNSKNVEQFDLDLRVTRGYQPAAVSGGVALDDSDRDDLHEIIEVGSLDVVPRKRPDLWIIRLRVEDDAGARLPDDEPVPEEEEDIDLQTLYDEFFRNERGLSELSAEVTNAAAREHLESILSAATARPAST
jgi:hypothetical protein